MGIGGSKVVIYRSPEVDEDGCFECGLGRFRIVR